MVGRSLLFLLVLSVVATLSHADPVMPMVNQQGKIPVAATRTVQMKFAVIEYGLPQGAEATATVTNGFVTGIALTNGGAGYITAPSITIADGGGSGAKAVASISAGHVVRVDIHSAGLRYTSAPEVIIAPPPTKPVITTLWSNDNTSVAGSEPHTAVTIQVSGGTFSALLGYTGLPNMAPLPTDVLSHVDARVRVWYRPSGTAYKKLPVDEPLQQQPFAQTSEFATMAGTIADGSVSLTSFAPGVVNSIQAAPFQNIEFPSLSIDQLTLPTLTGTSALANPYLTSQDTSGGTSGELLLVSNVFGNALAIQNKNDNAFSAIAFRSPSGAEHAAFGLGGGSVPSSFRAYEDNLYFEITDANSEGWTPSFGINQQTTYNGTTSLGSNVRVFLSSKTGFLQILPRGYGTNIDPDGLGMWFFDPDTPVLTGFPSVDLRGADSNWSILLRSSATGINGNDYSCIAGTLSDGGGHRFYVGGRQNTLATEIAKDRTSVNNVFHVLPQTRPSPGSEGDMYQDSGDHHFYIFNGTDWRQLDN